MSVKPTLVELILNATAAGKSMLSAANAAAQKTLLSLVKGDVGLANVDNTSDANKPVSTAQQTALDAKADLVGGVVPSAQIPAIAITEYLGSVANQAAMLALTGDRGDWCLRSDTGTTFVLSDDDSTFLASWVELNYPTAPVTSVNGETGAVTLSASDVGAAATSHTHAQSDVTGLVSDLSGKQATLVSGTNIKTINSTSLLGSGDISVGGVGGSTGSTDNRVLRSDGTGGATVQNSAVTIDDSGNVTTAGKFTADRTANTDWLSCQYATSEYCKIGFVAAVGYGLIAGSVYGGTASGVSFGTNSINLRTASKINIGTSGAIFAEFDTGSNTNPYFCINAVGLTTKPAIQIDQTAASTSIPLNIRLNGTTVFSVSSTGDCTASGLVSVGVYTFATVPSASSNTGKFLRISDRAQKHAYSDGTNWRFFGDDAIIS